MLLGRDNRFAMWQNGRSQQRSVRLFGFPMEQLLPLRVIRGFLVIVASVQVKLSFCVPTVSWLRFLVLLLVFTD